MTEYIKALSAFAIAAILMLALPVFSVNAFSSGLEVSSAEVLKGEAAELSVSISGNPGLAAVGFEIHYDRSALVLTDAYYTNIFGDVVKTLNISSYPLVFNFADSKNMYGNGVLLKLVFKASEGAAPGDYSVTPGHIGENGYVLHAGEDGSLKDVSLVFSAGVVSVREAVCHHFVTSSQVVQHPACTVGGSEQTYCTQCGEVLGEGYIPPSGHSYGEWEVQKAPTEQEEGTEIRRCSLCGTEEARSVPKLVLPDSGEQSTSPETTEPATAPPLGDASPYLFLAAVVAFAIIIAAKLGKNKNSHNN